jgi:hypothetical protein
MFFEYETPIHGELRNVQTIAQEKKKNLYKTNFYYILYKAKNMHIFKTEPRQIH